jgi:hypothetical protein
MVAVPEPGRVAGFITEHVKPGGRKSANVTVPAKPSSEVTVTVRTSVVVPSAGAARTTAEFNVETGNVAAIVKSWTVYMMLGAL